MIFVNLVESILSKPESWRYVVFCDAFWVPIYYADSVFAIKFFKLFDFIDLKEKSAESNKT